MPKKKQTDPVKYTCQSALEDARSVIEELGQEMRDWFDNTPEGLQNSDKMQRVDEAANTLEEAASTLEDAPECAEKIPEFEYLPCLKRHPSRAARLSEAIATLDATIDAVNAFTQHATNPPDPVIAEELLSWVSDSLDSTKDMLSDVEFPGMYG